MGFNRKVWQEAGKDEIVKFKPLIIGSIEGPSVLAACLLALMYGIHESEGDIKMCEAALVAVQMRLKAHGVEIDLSTVKKGFEEWLQTPEGQAEQRAAEQAAKPPDPKEGDWLVS